MGGHRPREEQEALDYANEFAEEAEEDDEDEEEVLFF